MTKVCVGRGRPLSHGGSTDGRQRGFTLLELMIAMAIGLVILAASLLVFTSSSRGSATSRLETQLNEDGILALNIIQQQLKQAGYSQQIRPPGPGTLVGGNFSGPAVRGCDGGFTDSGVAFDSLACTTGTGSDAIAVRYQATTDNTLPTSTSLPTNCIGNGINAAQPSQVSPATTRAPGNYALADNRYFVSSATALGLSCRGTEKASSGTTNVMGTEQPLLSNVENMQIRYGIASLPSPELAEGYDPMRHQIIGYKTATEIDELTGAGAANTNEKWSRVLSVRVCLLMRSELTVADVPDGGFTYKNCDNIDTTSTDSYLRRAFTTTVLLRNRLIVN